MSNLKPSDFSKIYPWNSATQSSESETIAMNIMKILKKTGDIFRKLEYEEYKEERLKDGNYSECEKEYFDQVIDYCVSPETARVFSYDWRI